MNIAKFRWESWIFISPKNSPYCFINASGFTRYADGLYLAQMNLLLNRSSVCKYKGRMSAKSYSTSSGPTIFGNWMFCAFKSSAYYFISCKSIRLRRTITGSINILSCWLSLSSSAFISVVRCFFPSFSKRLYCAINSWKRTPRLSTERIVDRLGVWNNSINANKTYGLLP